MIRVASYCRVSTDSQDQANSFASQQRYFREYIQRHPDWELYAVYADEGVTGTSTRKRVQFINMINDAYLHKFDLIITKEVSRFSRNLLDTIAYTRELKALGIGVIFMNDGFSSLDPDSELRLSIMGSIAQEESRKTSSRVKWGQSRQMERGVVFGPSLLGYHVKDGKMTVCPEGAEIVRLIFYKYGVEKKGTSVIARELQQAGYKTCADSPIWNTSHIVKILHNEKYVGDLVQKKSITTDYLSHEKKINRGEEPLIVIRDHHEPIIDRGLWDTVQMELQNRNKRNDRSSSHSTIHPMSGKIVCGECGARFVARYKKGSQGNSLLRWSCYGATTVGRKKASINGKPAGCDIGRTIRDDLVREIVTEAIKWIPADFQWMNINLVNILKSVLGGAESFKDNEQAIASRVQRLNRKIELAIDAYISGSISESELQLMKDRYNAQIRSICNRYQSNDPKGEGQRNDMEDIAGRIHGIIEFAAPCECLIKAALNSVTVMKDGSVAVRFHHIPQICYFRLESSKNRINKK